MRMYRLVVQSIQPPEQRITVLAEPVMAEALEKAKALNEGFERAGARALLVAVVEEFDFNP